MSSSARDESVRVVGRYALFSEIAAGGMATVHLGRLLGPVGFSRTVAIKRLHATYAKDPEFVSMFLDEARLAARVRHPNVVPVLDVVTLDGELFLVMDYVEGESLAKLLKTSAGKPLPANIVVTILAHTLYGLHAAHEARSERDEPLLIVHRDVSPQNILVGADGVARVTDFGVAKATNRLQSTQEGQLKGKLAYMSPEQLREETVDRRTDIYAAAIVAWESFTGLRLYASADAGAIVTKILTGKVPPPSQYAPGLPAAVDAIVMRGLAPAASDRFETAREFARALEGALAPAPTADVSEWMGRIAHDTLDQRARRVAEMESVSSSAELEGVRDAVEAASTSERVSLPTVERRGDDDAQERSELTHASVSDARPSRRWAPLAWLVGAALGLSAAGLGAWQALGDGPARAAAAPSVTQPEPPATEVATTPSASTTPSPPSAAPPDGGVDAHAAIAKDSSTKPEPAAQRPTRTPPKAKPSSAATSDGDFGDLIRK
ncbi:MAG: protein kinase [Polyangiaceae bacterium]|nr:protein kinase [Polyangiaceae bacterium]